MKLLDDRILKVLTTFARLVNSDKALDSIDNIRYGEDEILGLLQGLRDGILNESNSNPEFLSEIVQMLKHLRGALINLCMTNKEERLDLQPIWNVVASLDKVIQALKPKYEIL